MPSATATASAFRKKPVELPPEPWSGRFDTAELNRPGGLLIAALMQCAAERGLSLHDMAKAMGVRYWDLSQLRVGFRRPEALDDDFAAACAAFIDVPFHTVHMLAGLLDPEEALTSLALTPPDIAHALQILACEPEELVLPVDMNPQRPLQALSVEPLADLHRRFGANPAVREALRAELRYRPPSKTELLRAAVQAACDDAAAPAPGIMRCTGCQTRLRIPHLPEPGEIRCPSCGAEYAVHWQEAVCVVLHQEPAADDACSEDDADAASEIAEDLTETQAWAVLGLPEGSPPEAIDRARRALLQAYHPDRLGHVPVPLRRLAEDAFKRVNDACEVLKSQR
jgi:DnaJ domain